MYTHIYFTPASESCLVASFKAYYLRRNQELTKITESGDKPAIIYLGQKFNSLNAIDNVADSLYERKIIKLI